MFIERADGNRLEKDYQEIKTKYDEMILTNEKYRKEIEKYQMNLLEEKDLLEKIQRYVRKLELQNEYLTRENNEYRKKMALIKDSGIGKIAIKGYHLLKRIVR